MQLNDVVKLRGAYEYVLRCAATGRIVDQKRIDNVVVTAGRRWVLQQLESTDHSTNQNLSHIAVGTSTVAPATSDTALGNESSRLAINSFTTSNFTSNPPSFRAEVSFNTNQANTTLGEFGIFNSSSGGTMLSRITFATINKTTSNTLAVSYTLSA